MLITWTQIWFLLFLIIGYIIPATLSVIILKNKLKNHMVIDLRHIEKYGKETNRYYSTLLTKQRVVISILNCICPIWNIIPVYKTTLTIIEDWLSSPFIKLPTEKSHESGTNNS